MGCFTSTGKWVLKVKGIVNGKLSVYLNNELVKEETQSSFFWKNKGGRVKHWYIPVQHGTEARIRTVLYPTNPDKPSSALAKLEAQNADASVDGCMTSKLCMAQLGDGTEAGFELRNNNVMQYKCLASGFEALPEKTLSDGSSLRLTCKAWVKCHKELHRAL